MPILLQPYKSAIRIVRSCPPLNHPTSVPTGPPIRPSIRSGSCYVLFFINEDKTKYVSVGYYPARYYQPLVEFGIIRMGGSKSLNLSDEQVTALADCLPAIRDSMCVGRDRVFIKFESGNFRLTPPRGTARPGCLWARNT